MSAPKAYATALRNAKSSRRRRPVSTSRDLTVFEHRFFAVMPEAIARDLMNTMRSILTLGGRKQRLLDMRKQRIKDLLEELGSNEAIRVYNEFATAHGQVEERLTFKLPLVEELEVGKEEVTESEDPDDDSDYHSAQEDLNEEEIVAHDTTQKEAEVEVSVGPDIEMEDILPETAQVSAMHDASSETVPSPSAPTPKPPQQTPVGVACERHIDGRCTVVAIQNPEAFPLMSIQEVQAEYYPFTRIVDMQVHRDEIDHVTQVTATLVKGPVDHLIINDPRIITLLGLRQSPYATICLQLDSRIDSTYQIHIQSGQRPRSPNAWIVGELISAWHAYLYWLDSRRTANPKAPPTAAEARLLAPRIGRRAGDVWREIDTVWGFEQGSGGRGFRENRTTYLGEDPSYGGDHGDRERRSRRSMWV
ncbi:hypothetical protein G6011_11781 [Alternaria panax]|uniref:Uncharacterized protein n=1 Tax=Alternaria panax TaxID=48097 RepID=A0AAD4F8R6_9PLEO|nr:hypothetical protein G6011_11781 [Alternaria panax]